MSLTTSRSRSDAPSRNCYRVRFSFVTARNLCLTEAAGLTALSRLVECFAFERRAHTVPVPINKAHCLTSFCVPGAANALTLCVPGAATCFLLYGENRRHLSAYVKLAKPTELHRRLFLKVPAVNGVPYRGCGSPSPKLALTSALLKPVENLHTRTAPVPQYKHRPSTAREVRRFFAALKNFHTAHSHTLREALSFSLATYIQNFGREVRHNGMPPHQ